MIEEINVRINIIVKIGIESGNKIKWKVCYGVVLLRVVVFFNDLLMVLK